MGDVLPTDGICKSFSGTQVLKDVSLELEAGQIICLAGESGVDKSTSIKILSGVEKPDEGKVTTFGTTYERVAPGQAMYLGTVIIYQDAGLVSSPTIPDNIFSGNEGLRGRAFMSNREREERTRRLLQNPSMDMKPSMPAEELSSSQKQNLQVAKALHQEARIPIVGEPTASLREEETASPMNSVEQLRKKGLGIIYTPCCLEEIFRLRDTAYVLKDGAMVKKLTLEEANQDELIKVIVGRDASNFHQKDSFSSGDGTLVAKHYSGNRIVRDVNFSISEGEVLGLGGLVDAGRTESVRMIYGAGKKDSGTLILGGENITPANPRSAVKRGVLLVSEGRKDEGLLLIRSARENLITSRNNNSFFLSLRKEKEIVDKSIQQLEIKVFSQEQEMGNLSDGNQQKMVISRWPLEDGGVYIFDEPTKGVDVGAREKIYRLIERLAKKQKIVIMVSFNIPELISMSDRIGVMKEGRLMYILDSAHVTEDGLVRGYIEARGWRTDEG